MVKQVELAEKSVSREKTGRQLTEVVRGKQWYQEGAVYALGISHNVEVRGEMRGVRV